MAVRRDGASGGRMEGATESGGRQRPLGSPGDLPRYELRPAAAADFAIVHALRIAGLRRYVEPIWGWDEDAQQARFRAAFDPTRYRLVVVAGEVVGALAVARRADAVFVADVQVAAAWRGRGIGTAVLGDVVAAAHRAGLPVALQVLHGNPARRLYERLGFRTVGETATHVLMRAEPPGIGGAGDGCGGVGG
jgi:GNAT superfamily N-acetyltransferase